jgi:hypothetical protein
MDPKALLERAVGWVRRNPDQIVEAAKNAAGLRLTVPLDALRWLASEVKGKNAPTDVEIVAVPPGVRVGLTVNVMKTTLRAALTLFIDRVRLSPDELTFELRVRDVALFVIGNSDSPVATLVRSGALDLSKPGKLVGHLPKRPAFLVEADGDRLVIDLMRDDRIARKARRYLRYITPLVTVNAVEANSDHLGVQLACLPDGLGMVVSTLRGTA